MKSAALFFLRYVLIAGCIAGAFYSVILARAAHLFNLDTAASIPEAVRLVPYESQYVARLAAWQLPQRVQLLKRAVELNPFDFQSLIQLGIITEISQGDAKTAEAYFLKATAVNHMFLPKMSLANFYFRQQNESEFFHWANEALKVSPYDGDQLFTQMWLLSQDQARLSAAVPDRTRTLVQYTSFLSRSSQFNAIPPIVQRLVRLVGSDNQHAWSQDALITAALDRVLAGGDLASALQIWTTLRDAHWIPFSVPDANHPLTNGDFHAPFYRHGFDWVPVETEAVRAQQFADTGELEISLSGDQPERCDLLRQYVAIQAGFLYRMQWKAEAQNIIPGSGLAWHLRPVRGDPTAEIASSDLLNKPQDWQFVAPPGQASFVLTLEYKRQIGRTRANGRLILHSVSIERQP